MSAATSSAAVPLHPLASMRFSPSLVTILALAATAACSSDSVTDSRTLVGLELSMSPARDTLFLGGADTLTKATVAASAKINGRAVPLPGHVFESGDTAVATVSAFSVSDTAAVVTAVQVGTTTVAVRVNGERATTTIVVLPILKSVAVTAPVSQVLVRDTIPLTYKAFGWDGSVLAGQPFTFTSSSPSATVSPTGVVTFTAPGSATITARSGDQIATVALSALAREFIGGAAASLSSGLDATCGLLPLGRTYCFGRAPLIGIAKDTTCFDDRQPSPVGCTLVPLRIAGELELSAVTVGDSVACGLNPQGRAYCWGDQTYGQIGNGISKPGSSALPTLVTGPHATVLTFSQISAGAAHACGLATNGAAYCWGKDSTYQLGGGDGLALNSTTPIPVKGGPYKSIAAGRGHTCALRTDGVAECWGDNRNGQLGQGIAGAPVDVPLAVSGLTFTQLSARGDNTCGVTSGSLIFCWGANESGQTGQTVSDSVPTPSQVPGTGYTTVSVGGLDTNAVARRRSSHVCALANGSAVCWGGNEYGQLGRGTFGGASSTPVTVTGFAFTAISAGTRSTCAVAADGAYCWGSSVLGAVGNQVQALKFTSPTKSATPQ
jgi:hypothetical protein